MSEGEHHPCPGCPEVSRIATPPCIVLTLESKMKNLRNGLASVFHNIALSLKGRMPLGDEAMDGRLGTPKPIMSSYEIASDNATHQNEGREALVEVSVLKELRELAFAVGELRTEVAILSNQMPKPEPKRTVSAPGMRQPGESADAFLDRVCGIKRS